LSGEAYFKVTHNPEKPFVVKTNGMNITALGTEFNVLVYPDENNIETTLVNGKVKIEKHTENGGLKNVGIMVPGQHVNYNKLTNEIWSETGNIERYISWKEGKLVFKDESIVKVTNKLSRWYNVEFEFADDELLEYPYTATFVDESLTQILDLLKLATPIDYKISLREKLPNGTFSKQKVTIWKRH
jgi:ferric-dicitrate binding protein FerR (iron transport regulator)